MLRELLEKYRDGECSLEETEQEIEGLRIETIGDFARLDLGRRARCGIPEVVLAEGKDESQLAGIAEGYVASCGRCIITRINSSQSAAIRKRFTGKGIITRYNENGRVMVLAREGADNPASSGGIVGIVTAGTSDIAVAEEARSVAEEMGCRVLTAYDVGAAGIHRLFPAIREILDAHVFIVAAGREGTLPAIVAGLVDRPVIGVPVSTGYGYMGQGRAALASMLQSCSVLTVVNIDAGFTAGAFAARVANMVAGPGQGSKEKGGAGL